MTEYRIMSNLLVSDEKTGDGTICFFIILRDGALKPLMSFPDVNILNKFIVELDRISPSFLSSYETRPIDWSKIDQIKKEYSRRHISDQK